MEDNIKKPNFFLLGGPRCGTTALSEYLRGHPEVFFSYHKEPHFFNTDHGYSLGRTMSEKKYLKRFFSDSADFKAVGEGSTHYLYSKEAVPNILKFNSNAKFIVMVRNPIDMAHSPHPKTLQLEQEDVEDFKTAWDLQKERALGRHIPKKCSEPESLQYGEVCKTGKQLKRLYKLVPPNRLLVIIYDDFKKNPGAVYKKTLEFLGLSQDNRTNFPVINPNAVLRSKALTRFLRSGFWNYPFIGFLSGKIKKAFNINHWPFMKKLHEVSRKNRKRGPMKNELRKKLADYFKEDVKELSELIYRDLTYWTKA